MHSTMTITDYATVVHQDVVEFLLWLGLRHPKGLPGLTVERKTEDEWNKLYREWQETTAGI